ncbi:unnamed protein product [Blepharisma stoltei]|uniref:Uncharacterized protein n=1 Tax=Blepharisma stoltei TaxID=1481888 RepID=A0AAU9JC25_9CILI|nr:unnamed protein product [Blepharisma stoltei]
MQVSGILEDLKDYHKNAMERDEITNFREDLLSLIHDSYKKGYLRGVGKHNISVSDFTQNNYVTKINSLLPKQSQIIRFNIFSLLAKMNSGQKININIPLTLIRNDESSSSYLVQTLPDGSVQSKPLINKSEFFNCIKNKEDGEYPSFVYRVHNKDTILAFSGESAEEIWNSFDGQAIMQRYIQCRSNPVSIIRVLWKKDLKNRYFSIVNKNKYSNSWVQNRTRYKKGINNRNKSFSNLSDFKYTNMLLPTTQSINNPFKLKKKSGSCSKLPRLSKSFLSIPKHECDAEPKGFSLSQSFSEIPKDEKDTDSNRNPESITRVHIFQEESNKDLIINTNDSESCYAVETFMKIPEVDAMINQIITFLTTDIFPHQTLKGIVCDFIQSKKNGWVFLGCREQLIDFKFSLGIEKAIRPQKKLDFSRRSHSVGSTSRFTDVETEHRISRQETKKANIEEDKPINTPLPFKFKPQQQSKKEKQHPSDDNDFVERVSKVNERLGQINTQKPPACLKDFKQDSIKYYQKRNPRSDSMISPQCPVFNSYTRKPTKSMILSGLDEKSIACAQRALRDAIDNFDEMAMNMQISKIKKQNLVEKYGGVTFWNQLIVSLYNKILSNDTLNRYFKNTRMGDFEMIVSGMFKIFNGRISLEFRRAVRKNHQGRGITEKEFWFYVDIYESTLKEFNIDEEDQKSIMSQLRSMKGLIVR